jgi:UDP-glucose 4-epimerase
VIDAVRNGKDFVLNGTDYETPDGTCIRDYIHVEDLAQAHILAMDRSIPADVYNLGANQGHSNMEVIQIASAVTDQNIAVLHGPRRAGDPIMLTADASKFMAVSGWKPQFALIDMIRHAWAWYTK